MWRLTDDFWDQWPPLREMFERCHEWTPFRSPGHWPDPDMLPLGHLGLRSVDGGAGDRMTRFTQGEQRTLMTLWCMAKAPLMFGGELRDSDPFTLSLLTNRRVLEIQQHSTENRQFRRAGDEVVWTARSREGALLLALFNLGETPLDIGVTSDQLGVSFPHGLLNLWTGVREVGGGQTISLTVPPHEVVLLAGLGLD